MRDPRITILAKNLINRSVKLKEGENIWIDAVGETRELAKALVEETYAVGGNPYVTIEDPEINRLIITGSNNDQLSNMARWDSAKMGEMQAYIGVRGSANINEMGAVPGERMSKYNELYSQPVHMDIRVPKTKWCVLRYPNDSMAQLADMCTEDFEDFYFDVCNLDYSRMSMAMDALVALMDRTDKVRIVSPGTDLTFSIKDIPAIKCAGDMNIPDGEVYTAPVRDSVNGMITYNTPSVEEGVCFENVCLEFRDGKIINATANHTERVNEIFDTDEGARYVGEFALGVNPKITKAMKDILFDEKICGSIHFTPGGCYEDADNGNNSAVHWDLVLIQTPEYGGGEIWFDDVLIRKDGRFVLPELECLNPENLC